MLVTRSRAFVPLEAPVSWSEESGMQAADLPLVSGFWLMDIQTVGVADLLPSFCKEISPCFSGQFVQMDRKTEPMDGEAAMKISHLQFWEHWKWHAAREIYHSSPANSSSLPETNGEGFRVAGRCKVPTCRRRPLTAPHMCV